MSEKENTTKKNANANLLGLLKPYALWISLLVVLTILANGLNLLVPKIIASAIDTYTQGNFALRNIVLEFFAVAVVIFILTYLQNVVQTYSSERVARDLRKKISAKISAQDYMYVERVTPGKLLTNLTSDVDAVKNFRFSGHCRDNFFRFSYYWRKHTFDHYKLEAGSGCFGHHADGCSRFLYRVFESAKIIQKIPGNDRLAEQSNQ